MVKMVLGSSDAQGQTMSSVGKARVTAYNSAVTALSNFNGAGDLQGSAYDSGKQYGVSVITPLIKGAIMYSEYLSEAVPKLPSKYRSEVGGEDLDSAVLESEIQSLESSISSLRGTFRAMESSDHADKSLLQNISSRMDSLTSQKNEKMDKLRKLNLFAGSSNEVFSGEGAKSMDTVVKNLASGLNMIQGDFASFGGTFPKHSGKTMNWAKSIEGEWDKKAKIDEDYQKVLEKIKDGKELNEDDVKKINAYKKRYSNRELPKNVNKALNKYDEKIKEISKNEQNYYQEAQKLIKDIKDGDLYQRISMLYKLYPKNFVEKLLKNKEMVGLIDASKYREQIYGLLKGYEKIGEATLSIGKWKFSANSIGKAIDNFNKGLGYVLPSSAIKQTITDTVKNSKIYKELSKNAWLGKSAKFLGKAGTILTYVDLGTTFVGSAAQEFSESKHLGKAAAVGTIDTIKSIGPLEGATIGSAFGPGGTIVGLTLGAVNTGVQFVFPQFYSGVKKVTKEFIDDPVKTLKNTGKAAVDTAVNIGKGTINTVKDIANGAGKLFAGLF